MFPSTVGTVSVGVRTASTANGDTDDAFEVCFADSPTGAPNYCRKLDLLGVDDFRTGGFDRHHLESANMPRAMASHVIFRPQAGSGTDAVRISCLDVRFDGEPVFCADKLEQVVGSGVSAGEISELRMPLGNACVSCEGEKKLVHGPRLGAPDNGGTRVWVRTDATRKVGLYLSQTPDGANAVPIAWAYPTPENDFAQTLASAVPLEADRTYYYRVSVDDDVSAPWQPLRTAPSLSGKVRLGMGSCAKEVAQPVYSALNAAGLDLFLYLGDNHYGNSALLDVHRFEYRRMDALPLRGEFMAKTPSLATWDDHDYVENNSDGLCDGRATALRGFKEAWPNPSFGTPEAPGAFTKTSFGPVDVFMLDCRSYRPRVNDPARNCDKGSPVPAGQDVSAGPLGEPQYQWLMNSLAASQAPFKLVSCGSLVTETNGIDSWFSFSAARARLFAELSAKDIHGVVFASGDIHRSEFRKFDRGAGGYPLYELVSSPMARDTANSCVNDADPRRVGDCYAGGNSFVSVEVDGSLPDPSFVARIHDEGGSEKRKLELKRSEL